MCDGALVEKLRANDSLTPSINRALLRSCCDRRNPRGPLRLLHSRFRSDLQRGDQTGDLNGLNWKRSTGMKSGPTGLFARVLLAELVVADLIFVNAKSRSELP